MCANNVYMENSIQENMKFMVLTLEGKKKNTEHRTIENGEENWTYLQKIGPFRCIICFFPLISILLLLELSLLCLLACEAGVCFPNLLCMNLQ